MSYKIYNKKVININIFKYHKKSKYTLYIQLLM